MTTLVLAAVLAAGCGDDEPRPDARPAADPPPPDGLAAHALPLDEAKAALDRVSSQADDREGTPEGVVAARRGAEIARVLDLREPDEGHLDRARELLEMASRRKSLEGACDASLDLARLHARDLGQLDDAYAVAYRTARRFTGSPHEECVVEAQRMTRVLEAFRPDAARLSAIDADPDADDPSVQRSRRPERSSDEVDVEAWARERGELENATLERIAIYGAPRRPGETVDFVRVVLHFDHVAVFRRGELARDDDSPRRAYLDLARTALGSAVSPSSPVGGGGLVRVRAAAHDGGAARIVFDLEDVARYRLFFLTDPFRVVVDFERATAPVAAPVAPTEERAVSVVVLDPGHGGDEFGARHGGLTEAVLTLDIARRVARLLRARRPDLRILLTRERDEIVTLEERVAFANAVRADLFVSIHLNAADDPVDRGGVATFVLDTTDDRQAVRLAARENGTSAGEVTGLMRLFADLSREHQLERSRALAALVQRGTLAGGRRVLPDLRDRGVKSALFYVLVGARMPAVLVEASFLNQEEENRALATEPYREALADGLAEGIARYSRGDRLPE